MSKRHRLVPGELIGTHFGKLLVQRFSHRKGFDQYFDCLCDCGNRCTVIGNRLLLGRPKSCGCLRAERTTGLHPNLIKNIAGIRFGRLVAIDIAHTKPKKGGGRTIFWNCLCDCGKKVSVTSNHLRRGWTQSCGCLHKEMLADRQRTHGESSSRLYRIWSGMKKRCGNEKCINYKHYGARGISICAEWYDNFPAFSSWALSNGYADNLSIDRIDNDGNYEPSNCQWLTRSQNTSKGHSKVEASA